MLYDRNKLKNNVESRWVESLHAESHRLTLLVRDLLEINHIRMGQLHYELKECSLREVIIRAVENFRVNYHKREVSFDDKLGENGSTVVGDFDKLLQVVSNLLDNAAKFSQGDTAIIVRLKFKSPNYILQVKDRGNGIPKKDLPKVFDGYYKGKDSMNEGMGLGLFLSKNIVEAHRGSIHLHSRVNKGTLVEIQLPRAKI